MQTKNLLSIAAFAFAAITLGSCGNQAEQAQNMGGDDGGMGDLGDGMGDDGGEDFGDEENGNAENGNDSKKKAKEFFHDVFP